MAVRAYMITSQNPTPGTTAATAAAPVIPSVLSCHQLDDLENFIRENIPELDTPSSEEPVVTLSTRKLTTQDTLQRKKGFFIVPANNKFYYFKIGDVIPKGEHLFEIIDKRPPVLREGMVVIDKDVYFVTIEDIQRAVIRKSRKLKLKRGTITYEDLLTGNACISASTGPSSDSTGVDKGGANSIADTSVNATGRDSTGSPGGEEVSIRIISDILKGNVESGIGKDTELDESKAVNMAFHEQMRSLLGHVPEKEGSGWEEWEITEAT